MNYKVTVAYNGKDFSGYQFQPDRRTVQGELTRAFEEVLGECTVTGCSRTDSGVHAKGFVALVSAPNGTVPSENLPIAVNTLLPSDISVLDAEIAPEGFHPRYDVKSKEYRYIIYNAKLKDPFKENFSWRFMPRLDEKIMQEAANLIVGKRDFSSFMATGSAVESTVRTVFSCTVTREGDDVIVDVCGDGFLYNMVRIIVGTLVYVSTGKINISDLPEIISSCDRTRAGITAPPDGLYLMKVNY